MAETIYYLGVRDGNGSAGSLVFPNQSKSFYAASGTQSLHTAPEGTYGVSDRKDASAEEDIVLGDAKYKYRMIGTTKDGKKDEWKHWDPVRKVWRKGLLIHPDGGLGAGSAGCVVVRGSHVSSGLASSTPGSADMLAAHDVDKTLGGMSADRNVVVKYFDSVEEMEAYHKQVAPGVDIPKTPEAYKKSLEAKKKAAEEAKKKAEAEKAKKGKGKGKPSKTTRNATLMKGERTVVAGVDQLQVAHVTTPHDQGGSVAKGNTSIRVGPQMMELARLHDPTTDGHLVRTGEPSVMSA
jgi:hypothetical protein